MVSGVYYIRNNINNKYYIGQSKNINLRKSKHFSELRHDKHRNRHLQNAFNKYGEKNFSFSLIKACKPKYLNRFEKLYIKIYNSYNNGYNLTIGGELPPIVDKENNPFFNHNHTLESCIQMSNNQNNSTGFFRVYLSEGRYKYRWYENGKRKSISSVDINKLKEKVIDKELPWHKM